MNPSVSWNTSGSRVLGLPTQPRWREVQRGLLLVTTGHLVLFGLVASGAVLWSVSRGWLPVPGLTVDDREEIEGLALLLGASGAVFGCLLTLLGQWLCIRHAPQDHGAKELVFSGILAVLVAAPLAASALYLGELSDGRALERILDSLLRRTAPSLGSVLLAAAAALALVNVLTFSQFARIVATRFESEALVRIAGAFFVYVCLLLGGSAGAVLALGQVVFRGPFLAGAGLAWAACLPWHALLVVGARGAVRRALRAPAPGLRRDGRSKPFSGQHRTFKAPVG
jgi:hypothetical protein